MTSSEIYQRDPSHWLYRYSPEEWIAVAMTELQNAEHAYKRRDSLGLVAGAKRAAGMALNATLIVRPREAWGRTYAEHLEGLALEMRVPELVRNAARAVRAARAPSSGLVALRSRTGDEALLDATRTVMAHAYAVVHGTQTREAT